MDQPDQTAQPATSMDQMAQELMSTLGFDMEQVQHIMFFLGWNTDQASLTLSDLYAGLSQLESESAQLRYQLEHNLLDQAMLKEQQRSVSRLSVTQPSVAQRVFSNIWSEIGHRLNERRASFHGLQKPLQALQRIVDGIRVVANTISRPLIRQFTILDLPEEILRQIFEEVSARCDSDTQNIQNIRLTCRDFRFASSHLLLRDVDVYMDSGSIARLDEIASHPLISKGVTGVRIHLEYYSSIQATSLKQFGELALEHLQGRLQEANSRGRLHSVWLGGLTDEEFMSALLQGTAMAWEWNEFLLKLGHNWDEAGFVLAETVDKRNVAALARAYDMHQRKVLDQNEVLERGAFVRAVATAMSKLRPGTKVFISDRIRHRSLNMKQDLRSYYERFGGTMHDPQSIASFGVTARRAWHDPKLPNHLEDQPNEVLRKLLLSVIGGDHHVHHLSFDMSCSWDMGVPSTSQSHLDQMRLWSDRLPSFHFHGDCFDLDTLDESARQGLGGGPSVGSLMEAFLGGQALKHVDIDFGVRRRPDGSRPTDPVEPLDLGPIFRSRTFPALESVRIRNVRLHLEHLRELRRGIRTSQVVWLLDSVYLASGTWLEVLDLLRGHDPNPRLIELSGKRCEIRFPRGAEIDDLSTKDLVNIFSGELPDGSVGTATKYIRGLRLKNPLRERERLIDAAAHDDLDAAAPDHLDVTPEHNPELFDLLAQLSPIPPVDLLAMLSAAPTADDDAAAGDGDSTQV